MDEQSSRLLTAADVAKILNIEKGTVYEAASRGRLPTVRLWRGQRRALIRFRRSDIEQIIRERTVPAGVGK